MVFFSNLDFLPETRLRQFLKEFDFKFFLKLLFSVLNISSINRIGLLCGLLNKTLNSKKYSIESIIDLFTINPSRIINVIPNVIQEGNIAELNIINPKHEWIFTKDLIQSKSSNSPLVNKKMIGKVVVTINKGYISSCKI